MSARDKYDTQLEGRVMSVKTALIAIVIAASVAGGCDKRTGAKARERSVEAEGIDGKSSEIYGVKHKVIIYEPQTEEPAKTTAQEQQRFTYHSSSSPDAIVGGLHHQRIRLTADKPELVNLPDFNQKYPLFFKWASPMAQNGFLFVAIDRTSESTLHDLLYIDSNGDGSLEDETARRANRKSTRHVYFGPVQVRLKGEEGPIPRTLHFTLYDDDPHTLFVYSSGWYLGTITANGAKKQCMLIDYNANGTFNDKSLDPLESDRIRIGAGDNKKTLCVGNYIEIYDKLYKLEVASDGTSVKLAVANDVEFGRIRLPETITEFTAGGENGLFAGRPYNGIVELPLGKYRVDRWNSERKDDSGSCWKLEASGSSQNSIFEVNEMEEIELDFGETIISSLNFDMRSGTYYFRHSMKGQLGESIVVTRNGARPPAPRLRIRNADGTYDQSYDFKYG